MCLRTGWQFGEFSWQSSLSDNWTGYYKMSDVNSRTKTYAIIEVKNSTGGSGSN